MTIEKYDRGTKMFVFYSNNDLLIPCLKLLLKDYTFNPKGVSISYGKIETKFRKKQKAITVSISIYPMENNRNVMKEIERLIKNHFYVNIKHENSVEKLLKIKNKVIPLIDAL